MPDILRRSKKQNTKKLNGKIVKLAANIVIYSSKPRKKCLFYYYVITRKNFVHLILTNFTVHVIKAQNLSLITETFQRVICYGFQLIKKNKTLNGKLIFEIESF